MWYGDNFGRFALLTSCIHGIFRGSTFTRSALTSFVEKIVRAGKGRMAAAIFQQCKLFSGCPPSVHSAFTPADLVRYLCQS